MHDVIAEQLCGELRLPPDRCLEQRPVLTGQVAVELLTASGGRLPADTQAAYERCSAAWSARAAAR